MQLELPLPSLASLANGEHERCKWCRAPFWVQDGRMQRHRALDGFYYCNEAHASAPYLTPRFPQFTK